MAKDRHSFVAFYTSDWIAGTARMPRLMKSVYHDICLYIWDKNEAVPEIELEIMLSDLPSAQATNIVEALIKSGRLIRNEDGSVYNVRAMSEAGKAFDLWERKSRGGKNARVSKQSKTEPDPDPDPDPDSPNGESTGKPVLVGDAPTPADKKPNPADRWQVMDAWNKMAGPNGLATVQKLNESRTKALNAAIGEYGTEKIIEAIARVPANDFLMGRKGTWKANLDDLMRPKNRGKFVEGGYEQGEGAQSAWR